MIAFELIYQDRPRRKPLALYREVPCQSCGRRARVTETDDPMTATCARCKKEMKK